MINELAPPIWVITTGLRVYGEPGQPYVRRLVQRPTSEPFLSVGGRSAGPASPRIDTNDSKPAERASRRHTDDSPELRTCDVIARHNKFAMHVIQKGGAPFQSSDGAWPPIDLSLSMTFQSISLMDWVASFNRPEPVVLPSLPD